VGVRVGWAVGVGETAVAVAGGKGVAVAARVGVGLVAGVPPPAEREMTSARDGRSQPLARRRRSRKKTAVAEGERRRFINAVRASGG
jgi:hypothetical protein